MTFTSQFLSTEIRTPPPDIVIMLIWPISRLVLNNTLDQHSQQIEEFHQYYYVISLTDKESGSRTSGASNSFLAGYIHKYTHTHTNTQIYIIYNI